MSWKFEESSRNVHVLRCDTSGANWEQWVLVISDQHWDHPKCRRDLLANDMEEAVKRNAPILSLGDALCCMQGKFDKRGSKGDVRPEHAGSNYFDRLVSSAAEWHDDYKSHFALLARGNHETAVLNKLETDLVERLAERLRASGGITKTGGYGGWVRFLFHRPGGSSQSKRMFYFHGHGGGGPVTQGTIDFSRYGLWVQNADILASGHIHRQMQVENVKYRLNDQNVIEKIPVSYIRTGTYKEEDDDCFGGWHTEKGHGPRPIGGYWMRFFKDKEGRVKWSTTKTDS